MSVFVSFFGSDQKRNLNIHDAIQLECIAILERKKGRTCISFRMENTCNCHEVKGHNYCHLYQLQTKEKKTKNASQKIKSFINPPYTIKLITVISGLYVKWLDKEVAGY